MGDIWYIYIFYYNMYINKFYPGRSFPPGTESTSKSHLRDTGRRILLSPEMDWIDPWWWNRWERKQPKPKQNDLGHLGTWATRATWATWHLRTTKLLDSNEGDMDSVVGWHSEDMRMLPMWNVSLQERLGWMGRGKALESTKFSCDGVYHVGLVLRRTPLTVNQMICLCFYHPK